jgi:tetratricopeptide (TPR) repeat protein
LGRADRHLTEALARCRGINAVDHEADILLDLARLRWDEAQTFEVSETSKVSQRREEALRLAEEALTITERSGYVLQGADVHLFLAEMEMERGDQERALEHARAARRLATCDGPPDHTYKVAYDEAGALLAQLGESGG